MFKKALLPMSNSRCVFMLEQHDFQYYFVFQPGSWGSRNAHCE